MSIWHITGGTPLRGQVRVQGSKNAVLPVIAASLRAGIDAIAERIAHESATPADGPSFGTAPSGT